MICKSKLFSGERWLGLENLHRLTSEKSYSLKVTMTDYDGAQYVAVYDKFKVRQINKKERCAQHVWIFISVFTL